MSRRYDCSDPDERAAGIADAVSSVRRGELVVVPTDTVYGVGADAFLPSAVQALLDAKGRGREMPVPVLVGSVRAATALVEDLGTYGQDLLDEFWPGALTVVCRANTNLSWDLGETKGTVAIRMPLHELAIEMLKQTGPMAVSSANLSGRPPARTAAEAEEQLGDAVAVYLDGGESGNALPSSIVDLTGAVPRLLRAGAIPERTLRDACGVLLVETHDKVEDEDDDADAQADADVTEEIVADAGVTQEIVADAGVTEEIVADAGVTQEIVADAGVTQEIAADAGEEKDTADEKAGEKAGDAVVTTELGETANGAAKTESKAKPMTEPKSEAKDAPAE